MGEAALRGADRAPPRLAAARWRLRATRRGVAGRGAGGRIAGARDRSPRECIRPPEPSCVRAAAAAARFAPASRRSWSRSSCGTWGPGDYSSVMPWTYAAKRRWATRCVQTDGALREEGGRKPEKREREVTLREHTCSFKRDQGGASAPVPPGSNLVRLLPPFAGG